MRIARSLTAAATLLIASQAAAESGTPRLQDTSPKSLVMAPGYSLGSFRGTNTSDPTRPDIDPFFVDVLNQIRRGHTERSFDFSRWRVFRNARAAERVNYRGPHEFLTTTDVTPEPETWVLMGTGLLAIVGFAVTRGRMV